MSSAGVTPPIIDGPAENPYATAPSRSVPMYTGEPDMPAQMPPASSSSGLETSTTIMSRPGAIPSWATPRISTSKGTRRASLRHRPAGSGHPGGDIRDRHDRIALARPRGSRKRQRDEENDEASARPRGKAAEHQAFDDDSVTCDWQRTRAARQTSAAAPRTERPHSRVTWRAGRRAACRRAVRSWRPRSGRSRKAPW